MPSRRSADRSILQRVIDHVITNVYQLQAEILPPALSSGLDAGGTWTALLLPRRLPGPCPLFILKNEAGVFALVGDLHGFAFVRKEVAATVAEDADDDGDALDFNMI